MLRRLRVKFVAVIMLIATVMLCVVFGLLYHFTRTGLEAESVAMMQAAASGPFRPGAPDGPPGEVRLPCFTVRRDGLGRLTAEGNGFFDLSDQEALERLVKAALDDGRQTGLLREYGLRFLRAGPCVVFADAGGEQSALRGLVRGCAVAGALCFAAFLGVAVLLAFWMVRPVELAWRQQRQFVADASHELKTPLAVIMTNAELLCAPDCGEGDRVQFSGSVLAMSRRMRTLTERLLDLARADDGRGAADFEPVDLSGAAEEALLPFEPVFFERGLELTSQIQPGIVVEGSGQQLRQLLDILLDNAQKYAAPGGTAELRLERTGRRWCTLSLSNPGELSGEELRHIFRRFYRADRARSGAEGFGLGLSIAEGIAGAHHGRIWAACEAGTVTFFVRLPVAAGR